MVDSTTRLSCLGATAALALLCAGTGPAAAQTEPRTDLGGIWTMRAENDKISTLAGGSDQNYTSGVQLVWTSGEDAAPDFAAGVAHWLWGDGKVRIGFGISQQFFTPVNTALQTPDPRDRPYAGYLAGTASLIEDSGNKRDLVALSLGVVGPSALGRQTQNGFHTLIGVATANGWSHQLADEPAVEVLAQRTWRIGSGGSGFGVDMLPSVAMGVGTVRDYLQTDIVFRVGQGLNSDFGTARIRPGISTGDAFVAQPGLVWYVFGGANGQVVARDAFLDGDLFSRSPHVARSPLLGELEAGLAVIWHGVRVSYTQTWETQLFRAEKTGLFSFGSLAVSAMF